MCALHGATRITARDAETRVMERIRAHDRFKSLVTRSSLVHAASIVHSSRDIRLFIDE